MKKYYLLSWLIIFGYYLNAQTVSVGGGLFNTNQEVFKNGKQFQIDAGVRLSKILACNVYYSKGTSADIINFHPVLRIYSFNRPNTDTFYNVTETNKFSFKTYLFKARFYFNPKNKLNFFITPIVGFSKLTETKTYKSQDYNTTEKYPVNNLPYISTGLEIGLEFPLTKRKNILLNVSNSFLYIFSQDLITDVYNPSFNQLNTHYNLLQFNLRYEFSKKFTTPIAKKKIL